MRVVVIISRWSCCCRCDECALYYIIYRFIVNIVYQVIPPRHTKPHNERKVQKSTTTPSHTHRLKTFGYVSVTGYEAAGRSASMQADQLILRERWFQNLLKNQKISSKFKSRHTMSTKQSSDSSSSDEENAPTLAQIMRSYMADEDATSTHLRLSPDSTVPVPATQ